MEKIKRFFSAPVFADETLSLRASLLSFIINLHLFIAGAVAILYLSLFSAEVIFALAALTTCIPALGMRLLLHRGKVSLAAALFIGFIAITMPLVAIVGESSIATISVTAFQFITIVMAGLLLGGRGAIGFMLFTCVLNGAVLYAEMNAWYPASVTFSHFEVWITQGITYTAVAALLWLANRLIQDSLARARRENDDRRTAETSLQLAVDAASLGTWTTDVATGKTSFSGRMIEIHGGQTPDPEFSVVHCHDRERVRQEIVSVQSGRQERYAVTHRIVLHDGSERWLDSRGLLSRDQAGKPVRFAGIVMDITDRELAEQERERLIHELEARNAELQQFTYTVSHDLKSPLITIGGFVGFLEKDALTGNVERVRADVAYITDAVAKMQRLLDHLLELSRIGRKMNPPEEVAFEGIAREAVMLAQGRIAARGVEVEIAPGLPAVYGDRARLVEVVQNLIDNACKFMGEQSHPQIEIGARQADGEMVFYVRDNGIGIEPRYHEQIFGLFDKLDPTSEGVGIGLALVKRVVETHGGSVWIESEVGAGSTFCFTLA